MVGEDEVELDGGAPTESEDVGVVERVGVVDVVADGLALNDCVKTAVN